MFIETLRSWQNFYFMIGGATATLIGLMFVALSLGMHLVSETTLEDMKVFVTPSVIYFISVLLLAGAMLIPAETPLVQAALMAVGGLAGLPRTVQHVRRLIAAANEHQDFDREGWLAQIISPVLSYVLILVAALCFAVNLWALAFVVVCAAAVVLLLCAIANTWSLVIWIVEQRRE